MSNFRKTCTYVGLPLLLASSIAVLPLGAVAFADDGNTVSDTTNTTSASTDTAPPADNSTTDSTTQSTPPEQSSPDPQSDTTEPAAVPAVHTLAAPVPQVQAVDTTKPVATLDAAPSILNSSVTKFVIQASDNVGLAKIVGNIYQGTTLVKSTQSAASGLTGSHTVDLTGLPNGSYTLKYNALDTSGNVASTGTFAFKVDNDAPKVTVKSNVVQSKGRARVWNFSLQDNGSGVDYYTVDGKKYELSNNQYSDANNLTTGNYYGLQDGAHVLKVYDVAGNSTEVDFIIDTTGPTATVKPDSSVQLAPDANVGDNNVWQTVSYKLNDGANVVKAILNGVEKPLTPNVWSDLNGVKPGVFGAKEGLNTLVLVDALGNQSTYTFTLDTTKPVVNTPANDQWVSGTHTWDISQTEANPAKAYVEIDQLVNGKWKKYDGVWIYNSNDLSSSFDTTKLADGVQTQIKISTWDKAGNQSGASFSVKIDNTAPTATVKPESVSGNGGYESVSYKLYDGLSGVDYVLVNGVKKDLSNNTWSDVNGLKPGVFGAKLGDNTLTVVDVAGNQSVYHFTLVAPATTTPVDNSGAGGTSSTPSNSTPSGPSITLASNVTSASPNTLAMTGADPRGAVLAALLAVMAGTVAVLRKRFGFQF